MDKKLFDYVSEKYDVYQQEFESNIKTAATVSEMLHVYASYTGKLEALLDGITIEGK